jgi:nitrogen fixation NifU-like protein
MADSRQLYQEVILDHNKKPRNWGTLVQPTHRSEGLNPLCGDHIFLTLQLNDQKIEAIQFEGESCAICKASASMMTTRVKGQNVEQAQQMVAEFRDMATGKLDVDHTEHHLGRLTVFSGVRDLPTRVKCAILPWHTLQAALHSKSSVSTESGAENV